MLECGGESVIVSDASYDRDTLMVIDGDSVDKDAERRDDESVCMTVAVPIDWEPDI